MSPSLYITKGSSSGATLSFALRSKGEGGQPRYLIIQEIASHFSTPPTPAWQGIIGIMRLWSLKVCCKQNERPYALIIPTQQRFTAHMLYKTRLSKNL